MDDLIKSWLKFSSNVLVKTENMYFFQATYILKKYSFHTFTALCDYHELSSFKNYLITHDVRKQKKTEKDLCL